MTADRSLPHSAAAEEAILGACIIDSEAVLAVSRVLRPEHFYLIRNQTIYKAMLDLSAARSPIDTLIVGDELARRGQFADVGGPQYLGHLLDAAPVSSHVEAYARSVLDYAERRELLALAGDVARRVYDEDTPVEEARHTLERYLAGQAPRGRAGQTAHEMAHAAADAADRWAEDPADFRGWSWGLGALDATVGGMEPGQLTYIAARPGVGKSILLSQALLSAARQGARVVLNSLEMENEPILRRLAAGIAGVRTERVKLGRLSVAERVAYNDALAEIADLRDRFQVHYAPTLEALRALVLRLQALGGVDVLGVDYINVMRGTGKDRYEVVTNNSNGLMNLKRETGLHIAAAVQMSRAIESRADRIPTLADLKESGALEQDADGILALDYPFGYDRSASPHQMNVHLLKRRDGGKAPTVTGSDGSVRGPGCVLLFEGEYTRYRDASVEVHKMEY